VTAFAAALPQLPDAQRFFDIDIRAGRVVSCEPLAGARVPAYRMRVDFGALGVRTSSARITDLYAADELVGATVVGVVNLPPRQVGPVRSEVLVLGVYQDGSERVVLLRPDHPCTPGDRIG
jgi:tRNA-binding protein